MENFSIKSQNEGGNW